MRSFGRPSSSLQISSSCHCRRSWWFSFCFLWKIVAALKSTSSTTSSHHDAGTTIVLQPPPPPPSLLQLLRGGGGAKSTDTNDNRHPRRPVAIVTGGTRGIGRGIAEALAEAGYDLLLTYNSNKNAADECAAFLEARYNGCRVIGCIGGDLTCVETRDEIFECLDDSHDETTNGNIMIAGPLRVLVHNAGLYTKEGKKLKFGDGSLLEEPSGEEEDELDNTNNDGEESLSLEKTVERCNLEPIKYYQRLYGDAWIDLCERSLKRMAVPNNGDNDGIGGSIIGISSPSVNPSLYRPDRTYSAPGSGKTIMEYSMRIYAKVVAGRNINVNIVVPGLVQTEGWGNNKKKKKSATTKGGNGDGQEEDEDDDESTDDMLQRLVDKLVPLKRIMAPRDIGNVVAFLCSPQGRFITGMTLPVDGGLHIN